MRRAYLIAEAGVNHEGSLDVALKMVAAAAVSGCDAIKFQHYQAEKLATAEAPAYWQAGGTQREAFTTRPFCEADYRALALRSGEFGIEFVLTPFHVEDVPLAAEICDRIKVASADITNEPLLRAVASTGIPVLLSTGASTIREVATALHHVPDATVLHCVLSYPTLPGHANLPRIQRLKGLTWRVGYSDHTLPEHSHTAIMAAYVLGATVIEKHFTLDTTLPGNDHYHSFEPQNFADLRADLDAIRPLLQLRGEVQECEIPARKHARRSITASRSIRAGERIIERMVCLKRPGTGLQALPAGARAAVNIAADTTLTRALIRV